MAPFASASLAVPLSVTSVCSLTSVWSAPALTVGGRLTGLMVTDTLSLARLGATVTGLDFSAAADTVRSAQAAIVYRLSPVPGTGNVDISLTPDEWQQPTAFYGWSAWDEIAHLCYFDETGLQSATDEDSFKLIKEIRLHQRLVTKKHKIK